MRNLPEKSASERVAATAIAQEVIAGVRANGFFGQTEDGKLFLYDAESRDVVYIEDGKRPSPHFTKWLFDRHQYLPEGSPAERQAFSILTCVARAETPRTVHRFAHYDRDAQALYLNRYDGTLYRLDGDSHRVIDNGREAFFLSDDGGRPFDAEAQPSVGNHGLLQEKLVDDIHYADTETLSAETQRALFHTWLYALPFLSLLPGAPILLLEGEKGSGKTTVIKRVQKLLFDRITSQPLSQNKADEFPVMLLRSPICLLDNVDSYISWLPDQIAAYATGASWIKRKLYSDSEQVNIEPKSWIAVTSRNPASFRRDDVLDRSIILRLNRRTGAFASERDLMADLESYRAEIYGEWIWNLKRIIKAYTTKGLPKVANQRMSDYAALTLLIADVIGIDGKVIGQAFKNLDSERRTLQSEDDLLTEMLIQVGNAHLGEELTTRKLWGFLDGAAMQDGFNLSTVSKNPRALAAQLRSRVDVLGEEFDITQRMGAGRTKFYTFRTKT